jgi:hypothetical protein
MDFNERCAFCKRYIEPKERERWETMRELLNDRIQISPSVILFSNPEFDDIEEVLSQAVEESEFSSDGSVE